MDISAQLHCVFSAQITEQDGSYQVELPEREVRLGSIDQDETYRVAILGAPSNGEHDAPAASTKEHQQRTQVDDSDGEHQTPPVEEGEQRDVEIENLGDQGDGITRVERGFVVIVPDTEPSERVTVEITDVRENVAFATVVDRLSYYD
jgi:predicted RNA-binding protein with TRAM domain